MKLDLLPLLLGSANCSLWFQKCPIRFQRGKRVLFLGKRGERECLGKGKTAIRLNFPLSCNFSSPLHECKVGVKGYHIRIVLFYTDINKYTSWLAKANLTLSSWPTLSRNPSTGGCIKSYPTKQLTAESEEKIPSSMELVGGI